MKPVLKLVKTVLEDVRFLRFWLVFGGADNDAVFDSARADYCVSVSARIGACADGESCARGWSRGTVDQ